MGRLNRIECVYVDLMGSCHVHTLVEDIARSSQKIDVTMLFPCIGIKYSQAFFYCCLFSAPFIYDTENFCRILAICVYIKSLFQNVYMEERRAISANERRVDTL